MYNFVQLKISMSTQKEVELFFKNIYEYVKKKPIKELNKLLMGIDKDINIQQKDPIKYIIKIVADKYGITEDDLLKSKKRGTIIDARNTAYCLYHFNLGLSTRHIADYIFECWHNTVSIGIRKYKSINVKVHQDKVFLDNYKELSDKLNNYINE